MQVSLAQVGKFTLMQALSRDFQRMVELTVEDEVKTLERNIVKGLKRKFKKGDGSLARSVQRKKLAGVARWKIVSDEPHAQIREKGGVLKPRRKGRTYYRGRNKAGEELTGTSEGKRLAIPAPGLMRRAKRGMSIDQIARSLAGGSTWATYPSRSGAALMFRRGRNRPIPIAALARSVRVKGKPVWEPEAEKSAKRLAKKLKRRIRRYNAETGRRLRVSTRSRF